MSEPLRIFLSYRREDASGHAGRLYDALSARFGADNVFMDIDTIDLGADFAEVITRAVASCDVLIALIGRHWLSERLENPDDFVRLEVEAGLERDVFVIPAYVQGAPQPTSEQLPDGLASLARRQGTELRDIGWRDDVARLIERLERLAREKAGAPTLQPRQRRRSWLVPVVLALILGAGAVAALLALRGSDDGERPSGNAESRLMAAIPAVTRPGCQIIDYGEPAARISLECAGAGLAATYHLFPDEDVMDGWYVRRRELAGIEPLSGSCTASPFRGEVRYADGTHFCHVANGEPVIVWTDVDESVGAVANFWQDKRRPVAIESLLRQWLCCLRPQHS
jgi:hypothetical protein